MNDTGEKQFITSANKLFRMRTVYLCLCWLSLIGIMLKTYSLLLWAASFVLFLVWGVLYLRLEARLEKLLWGRFKLLIHDTGDFNPKPLPPLSGAIGKLGKDRKLELLAHGMVKNYPVTLWAQDCIFYPHLNNIAVTNSYRVLEITTEQNFYHVFVDSKRNDKGLFGKDMRTLAKSLRGNQQLTVEGDVNKYFRMYVPADARYKSLVTLTPEKLLALRDYGQNFDVEFVDNKIYVITRRSARNVQDVLTYQSEVIELLKNIGVNLRRTRTDIDGTLHLAQPHTFA